MNETQTLFLNSWSSVYTFPFHSNVPSIHLSYLFIFFIFFLDMKSTRSYIWSRDYETLAARVSMATCYAYPKKKRYCYFFFPPSSFKVGKRSSYYMDKLLFFHFTQNRHRRICKIPWFSFRSLVLNFVLSLLILTTINAQTYFWHVELETL